MTFEASSVLGHSGTVIQHEPATPGSSQEGQFVSPDGTRVNVETAPPDVADKLRLICVELRRVRRSTDPVTMKPDQRFLDKTVFFRRNAVRKAAVFAALDRMEACRPHIDATCWFRLFVLIDKLDAEGQLSALGNSLSRQVARDQPDWALEVMRHWCVRYSVGSSANFRSGAIRHLVDFWNKYPGLRAETGRLLAYLLFPDVDIHRPVASPRDWKAVLKLLPSPSGGENAMRPLKPEEYVVATGLLQAARILDKGNDGPLTRKLSFRLGAAMTSLASELDSPVSFAFGLRHAEFRTPASMNYRIKRDSHEARKRERQQRLYDALETAADIGKAVLDVVIAVGGVVLDILLKVSTLILLSRAIGRPRHRRH